MPNEKATLVTAAQQDQTVQHFLRAIPAKESRFSQKNRVVAALRLPAYARWELRLGRDLRELSGQAALSAHSNTSGSFMIREASSRIQQALWVLYDVAMPLASD